MARKLFEQSHELTLCLSGMGQERREIIIRAFRDDTYTLHGAHRHMIPSRVRRLLLSVTETTERIIYLLIYLLS